MLGLPTNLTFKHVFVNEPGLDFAEICLHHLTFLALASMYLISNMLPVGVMVLFLHEFSEITADSVKLVHYLNLPDYVQIPTFLF